MLDYQVERDDAVLPDSHDRCENILSQVIVIEQEVIDMLCTLNANKAVGPDIIIIRIPASTLRIHNVAVWLLFGQVPFLRENYVATTYFRYVICKSL